MSGSVTEFDRNSVLTFTRPNSSVQWWRDANPVQAAAHDAYITENYINTGKMTVAWENTGNENVTRVATTWSSPEGKLEFLEDPMIVTYLAARDAYNEANSILKNLALSA